jgi:hypothetical protein
MPKKFQTILFWFDGAFCESIAAQAVTILRPEISAAEKATLCEKMQTLQQALAVGNLDPDTFCRKAVDICQVAADPDRLQASILQSTSLNKPFFNIFSQIAAEHDPRVIVDIPQAWFNTLIDRWQVSEAFPPSRLIFTETFHLKRMLPDIAYYIPRAAGRNMEECILVDPLQMRAVELHKLGLVSTAYVYPRRLKIDLALQGIWKTSEDIYHPKAGARTNI